MRMYDVTDVTDAAVRRASSALEARTERPYVPPPMIPPPSASDQLVYLIEGTIDPTSWRDAGGTGGIRYFAGRLIVTQAPENHDQIMELLGALRRTGRTSRSTQPHDTR